MERYIDADALEKDLISRGFYPAIVKRAIEDAPTADVVSRVEFEAMRSAANSLKTHLEKAKQEAAREIFEEIEEMLNLQAKIVCETRGKYSETDEPLLSFVAMQDGRIYSLRVVEEHIAELKKKYMEEEQ